MKRLEDILNSSSSQRFYSIIKGNNNTGRPPNKACRYCCRKTVYPEKCNGSDSKSWRYPSSQKCFDCVMVHDGIFDQIRRRKKSKNKKEKDQQLLFPLAIFDITKNIMIGEYSTREKVQFAIDRYQQQSSSSSATQENGKNRKVNMLVVIHYPDYLDFTVCFANTHNILSSEQQQRNP
jgi:hypothetical protein